MELIGLALSCRNKGIKLAAATNRVGLKLNIKIYRGVNPLFEYSVALVDLRVLATQGRDFTSKTILDIICRTDDYYFTSIYVLFSGFYI